MTTTLKQYRNCWGYALTGTNKQFREYLSGLTTQCGVKRSDTITAAVKKRNARRTNRPEPSPTVADLTWRRATVPCGEHWQRLAEEQYPRRANWENYQSVIESLPGGWDIVENDNGRYSSRCTYTHWTYTTRISSYGVVLSPKRLRVRLGEDTRLVDAPHGYYWDSDGNGIKLVANSNVNADYHPTAEELFGPMRELTQTLRDNYRTRQAEAKAERARKKADANAKRRQAATMKQAVREGLAVCVADSRRAGNCQAGTAQWATRHGLDPARHYTPAQLLAVANGDTRRVTLVIHRAMQRFLTEKRLGFCVVADHRSN